MRTARRYAWLLLLLAGLVILTCMAQRLTAMRVLMPAVSTSQLSATSPNAADESPVTPCELSSKSLMATLPDLPVMLLPGLLLILALLFTLTPGERLQRARDLFLSAPPGRRRHLQLCVFRE